VSEKTLGYDELAAKVSAMLGGRNRDLNQESLPSSPSGSQAERIPPHFVESHSLLHPPGLDPPQSSRIVTADTCALGVAKLLYYVDHKLALTS
jgi:hypothetical protein